MLEEALNFPFKEQDWPRKIIIGSLLALASFLVLPAPLLIGYTMRVMRQESMPAFNNLIDMYLDGLKAVTIILAYLLPGYLLLSLAEGVFVIPTLLILLVGWWSFESGLYHFANYGFRQAFSFEALKAAFTLNYFVGIVLSIMVPSIIFIVYILSLVLVVPLILFPAVYFYQLILRWRIMKNAIEK